MILEENHRRTNYISVIFLALLVFISGCFSKKSLVLNRPVIKVNKHEISTEEYSERLARALAKLDSVLAKDESTLNRIKNQVSEQIILELIVLDFAKKNDISVSKSEIESEIDNVRSKYPDDIAFRKILAQENISYDLWSKEVEHTLLLRKVQTNVVASVPDPADAKIAEYFEKNKASFKIPARVMLRQIVVEKEETAQQLYEKLQKGSDMARLANEFSIVSDGKNGGVSNWIEKGSLEIFEAAFKMPIGARSKVVKSPYGYHIFEVLKREGDNSLSLQQAKLKIKALLREQSEKNAFSSWLEGEIKKSSVSKNDELIHSLTITTRGTP